MTATVYAIDLLRPVGALEMRDDWDAIVGAPIRPDLGGVTVAGRRGVIVSDETTEFAKMEDMPYVSTITEHKAIPERTDDEFDTPIELGKGIVLTE
jgi:hypothetical protein